MASERIVFESVTPLAAQDALKAAADVQRKAISQGRVERIDVDTRKHIFADFKNSEAFAQLYMEMYGRAFEPLSGMDFQSLIEEFRGGVLEAMAYLWIFSQSSQDGVVLSPSQTTDLYKVFYPDASDAPHPFGESSLMGISVPDGLSVTDDNKISFVYEYATGFNQKYFEGKVRAFNHEKVRYPELFSEAQLRLVIPRAVFRKDGDSDIDEIIYLPFTRPQFRNFVDDTLLHYSLGADAASIADIQSEMRRQREHALGLRDGQRTPQWESYLRRHS